MAVVNELPNLGGTEDAGIAYIGMGWMNSNTNNKWGLNDVMWIDREYFVKSDDLIIAQKDFDAILIIVQGFTSDGNVQGQRTIYNPPAGGQGDILWNEWGSYMEAHTEHHFTQGEKVGMWQTSRNSTFSAGAVIILVNEE